MRADNPGTVLSSPGDVGMARLGVQFWSCPPRWEAVVRWHKQDPGSLNRHLTGRLWIVGVVANNYAERQLSRAKYWSLRTSSVNRPANGRVQLSIQTGHPAFVKDQGRIVEGAVSCKFSEANDRRNRITCNAFESRSELLAVAPHSEPRGVFAVIRKPAQNCFGTA